MKDLPRRKMWKFKATPSSDMIGCATLWVFKWPHNHITYLEKIGHQETWRHLLCYCSNNEAPPIKSLIIMKL